jgi:sarcosine oxidase
MSPIREPDKDKYDVAVIGLGAMGSAALCAIAHRGLRVIGLEQFAPEHERGSSHGESRAIRLGYFEHPSYVPFVRRAYEGWEALERATGKQVLTRTGLLEIGRPGSAIVAGSLEASLLHGLRHEYLSAAEVMRRFPQFTLPSDYCAVFQPDGGFLRPELANSLHRQLALSAGAQLRFLSKVEGIEPAEGHLRLVTAEGAIRAERVIVTAGGWIGDLVPQLAPWLTFTRQVQCWFRPIPGADFSPAVFPVFIVDGEEEVAYGFPDLGSGVKCASHRDSGLLMHADQLAQDAGPADAARMQVFLERYLPQAAGALQRMRTCFYAKTPDEDFIIDRLPGEPRIVVASACSGHGYKFASVIGEVLADLAIEGRTAVDISRFTLARFASQAVDERA